MNSYGLDEKFDLSVEHSDKKKIAIEDIIQCVFGADIKEVADQFNRKERLRCG